MNRLNTATRTNVISCLLEGCSIRSTVRMTGVSKKAVMRLLCEAGTACAEYQDRVLRNLSSKRLQLDELWSWIYCKKGNVTPKIAAKNPHAGDIWLWTGLDADSKLIVSWRLGPRDLATAYDFTHDLADRVSQRVQITTDGLKVYLEAIESAFYEDVDYAVLQKVYGADPENERRYSPAKIVSSHMEIIKGHPKSEAHFDQLHRAVELEHAHEHAALHAALEWLQPEAGESRSGRGAKLLRVQFHQDSPDAEGHAGDGRQGHGSAVRRVRYCGATRSLRRQKSRVVDATEDGKR